LSLLVGLVLSTSSVVPHVRTIPDRFYLTGGNLHCVLGRL
jgi:hypothetical protein